MKLKDIILTINAQRQIIEQGSKLAYSYDKKNQKNFDKFQSKDGGYAEKLNDKRLELALVGEKNKEVLHDEKDNMLFTKEGTKEITKYNKELLDKEEEFEFYKVDYTVLTDVEKQRISNIDEEEYEILSRFINNIPEIDYKE